MSEQISETNCRLANVVDLSLLQSGDLISPYGAFSQDMLNYEASVASGTNKQLVTKSMANSYGFCVNSYQNTTNLSGITYTENQLIQIRDLIPDFGTELNLGENFYTFHKDISNYTTYSESHASSTVFNFLNYQYDPHFQHRYKYITKVEFILTLLGNLNYANRDTYKWNSTNRFTFSVGGSYIFAVLNQPLPSSATQNINLPFQLGMTSSTTSKPTENAIDTNLRFFNQGGSSYLGYYIEGMYEVVYLNLKIHLDSLYVEDMQGFGPIYVFNIPLQSLGWNPWIEYSNLNPTAPNFLIKTLTNT